MPPQVSIGIPFYNPGAQFKLALQSVFAQTFEDWELILLDDGSTDGSLELARHLRDKRVRVYSDGLNKRLNARLNELVRHAAAPYFFRMDADDAMAPERLELQRQRLAQSDGNTIVGSAAYSIDDSANILGFRPVQTAPSPGDAAHFFIHPTVCGFTKWFAANPYDEHYIYHLCEDAELWTRTAPGTRFINLPDKLLFYREEARFSFPKYLGAQPGLIYLLARRLPQKKFQFLACALQKLLKIWWVTARFAFGKTEELRKRHYRAMTVGEYSEAAIVLKKIQAQELPL